MLSWILATTVLLYGAGALYGALTKGLEASPYPSPDAAQAEMAALVHAYPALCCSEVIGQSTQGRPICAYRFRGSGAADGKAERPRLLVTAHIHAVEYIGSYVARALARRLGDGYGRQPEITDLLDRADVWIVPLLNPDGAARIWSAGGWTRLGGARFTGTGVDPNRNFPFVLATRAKGWNASSERPGSPYYRGPHPLSEPECLAVAQLAKREGFCAAINFHSFGGLVFMPQVHADAAPKAARTFAVFNGSFQSRQPHRRYRAVPERAAKIAGQLDSFLLNGFGTPSVTVEVSRPSLHTLVPWRIFNIFWWANPARPGYWVENDADAAIHALAEVLDQTGGTPCTPLHPELAQQQPEPGVSRISPPLIESLDKQQVGPSRRPREDGASSGRTQIFSESNNTTVRPEEPPSFGGVPKGVLARHRHPRQGRGKSPRPFLPRRNYRTASCSRAGCAAGSRWRRDI